MDSKFAAAIFVAILPLALGAQTPEPNQSPGRVVVARTESGQRSMQRQQEMEDRRRQQEVERQQRLEKTELQREIDRERRQMAEQRKQLQRLSAKMLEAQRAEGHAQQNALARVTSEPRSQSTGTAVH